MKIGAKVPNSGQLPLERGIGQMANALETAGFESLWVSDHVIMPTHIASRYPFAADGKPTWPSDTPYIDALIALTEIAAATEHAVIGTAVLVLPQRQPVELAKQAASIDVLSGGRLTLGIGAGWLAEEFEALGVPFETRGSRFVEWVTLLRALWEGFPPEFDGEHYRLPAGVVCLPIPPHRVPFLVGGDSSAALRRAGTICDGWLAHQSATHIDSDALRRGIDTMRRAAKSAGRGTDDLWTTLRIIDSAARIDAVADHLGEIEDAGVDEIIVDVDWSIPGAVHSTHGRLRDASSR